MSSKPAVVPGLESFDPGNRPVHLAIGMFDGVHRGHRRVIEAAVKAARQDDGVAAVLTFDPHPSRLFRPEDPTLLILPLPIKLSLLADLGVHATIVQPFDPAFARIAADTFAAHLKQAIPSLRAVYVGENFRFGARRAGDVDQLQQTAASVDLKVHAAPRLVEDDAPISSTRIRGLLNEGRIEDANTLLGYPYFAEGQVTRGKRLARTLNFPTLNLPWTPELQPRFGVYAVSLKAGQTPPRHGVANYGVRPTVESADLPLLETHLLGSTQLGPGDCIRVEWLHFLRPEQRFDSVDALKAQIARDVKAALECFAQKV